MLDVCPCQSEVVPHVIPHVLHVVVVVGTSKVPGMHIPISNCISTELMILIHHHGLAIPWLATQWHLHHCRGCCVWPLLWPGHLRLLTGLWSGGKPAAFHAR